jgi:1-deoxy-D-xylulose-5-phosphate synthase
MVLPDRYQDHDSPAKQYEEAGLAARQIVDQVVAAIGTSSRARAVSL